MWNEEWAYKHFFMLCNFFHINKKVLCISKFVIEKQTTVLFFFFFCSSVYWTWELDWCPGVAKKWWWVNKAWQVWFLLDCEQSLIFLRFSESNARARERRSRETRETRAAAREEKRETARLARANELSVGLTTQNTIGWFVKRWQQTVNNRNHWQVDDGWSTAGKFVKCKMGLTGLHDSPARV